MADSQSLARWQRVKEIVDRALDLDAQARPAYLESECGSDGPLRQEVRSLIEAAGRDWSLMDGVGGSSSDAFEEPPARSRIGERIGPYEILAELGRGGMGQVFLARRADDEFQKKVAIKLVPPGPARGLALERFRSERQISATLEHPNIARLLDGGTTAEGEPYFVMEYVEGESLLAAADRRRLSIADRLRLFRDVCGAVHYAHQQLVVHRDIKPSNILVTEAGVPKLLDFGIAKLLDPAGLRAAGETGTMNRILTPDYASPEQVRGQRVSTASDVYSLGVVLYELVSGRKPYRIETGDPAELVRLVCERDPEKPSARSPGLSADLDAIVLKALRKEPERRYASAQALSEDLERYLRGLPVRARRGTASYRFGKLVRRHRVAAGAAAVVLLALAGGAWSTLREARRARLAEARAERRFNDVRKLANSFLVEFHDAIQDLPGSTPARMLVVRRGIEYLDSLSAEAGDSPDLLRELATGYERLGDVQGNVGRGSAMLGDMVGARESLRKAIALRERLVRSGKATRKDRLDLVGSYSTLSSTLTFHGESEGAIAAAERAVAEATAAVSTDQRSRNLLASSRIRLGDAFRYAGRRVEALRSFEEGLRGLEPLAAEHPDDPVTSRSISVAYYKIGALREQSREYSEAAEAFRRAEAMADSLLRRDPGNGQYQRDVSFAEGGLGTVLLQQGDADGAEKAFRRQIGLMSRLAEAEPKNSNSRVWLAVALRGLGNALVAHRRFDEGRLELTKSVRILEEVTGATPDDVLARGELAQSYRSLGDSFEGDAGSSAADERRWFVKARSVFASLRRERKLSPAWEPIAAEVDETLARLDRREPGKSGAH